MHASARSMLGWVLVGLALRLLLLPATAHPDLLTLYDRVRVWSDGGFRLEDFHIQALPMLLHRAWVELGAPLPDLSGVPFPGTIAEYERESAAALAPPAALGWVFLWKLPYVLCDLACAALLVRLVPRAQAATVARLWLVHPVVIYVGAVFGRYDAIMLVPLLAGFVLLGGRRPLLAFACLGLAGAMRTYPFLLLLPAALASTGSPRGRAERLAAGVAPLAALLAASALGGGAAFVLVPLGVVALAALYRVLAGTRAEPLAWAACLAPVVALAPAVLHALENPGYPAARIAHHAEYLQRIAIGAREGDAVLLFFVAYGGACLWAHLRGLAAAGAPASARRDDALVAATLAALGFFAFSHFHPQYALLLVPLALFAVPRTRDGFAAHGLQVAGLALLLLIDSNGLYSVKLLLPLAPAEILRIPSAPEGFGLLAGEGLEVRALGRTLLVVGSAWMAWDLVAARGPRLQPRGALLWRASLASWPLLFLALAALFLTAPAHRALGPELTVDTSGGTLPSALRLVVGAEAPQALELQPPHVDPGSSGGGLRVSATATGGGATSSTWIPDSERTPDALGRVVLDLEPLALEPGRTYDLRLEPEARGSPWPTRVVALGAEEPMLGPLLRSARARVAAGGVLGAAWLGGTALCFVAGVLLVLTGGPRRDGAPGW